MVKIYTMVFFPFFYFIFFIVVQVQLPPFPPTTPPTPALPTSPLDPSSLWLCPYVLYTCSLMTLPPFPTIIPSHIFFGYCQFVLYFNVSDYIFLACFFSWLGSTYRGDHMVFVLHHLAYFT